MATLQPKGPSLSGQDQDDTVILPYTTAQKKLKGITWLDDILCSAVSPDAVKVAGQEATALLRDRHHFRPEEEDDFNIRNPEDIIQAQLDASKTLTVLLIAIASVSLIVGGIGIMNVMLVSVTERTREIGVRVAVGATEEAIQLQFLGESVMLSLVGGAAGVLFGIVGSYLVGETLHWPIEISAEAMVVAAAVFSRRWRLFRILPGAEGFSARPHRSAAIRVKPRVVIPGTVHEDERRWLIAGGSCARWRATRRVRTEPQYASAALHGESRARRDPRCCGRDRNNQRGHHCPGRIAGFGTIAKLNADFNSRVHKGDVVALIDPALFKGALLQATADFENAKANLAAARANLEKAKAGSVQAKADYDRAAELTTEALRANSNWTWRKPHYDSANASVGAADANVTQADSAGQSEGGGGESRPNESGLYGDPLSNRRHRRGA